MRKGKILRIKLGYNPNSSSIGTSVTFFVWGALAVSVAVNMVAAALEALRGRKRKTGKKTP